MTNNDKFYPADFVPGKDFNYNPKTTDLDISVLDDGISIRIDEHLTNWDAGGYASITISKADWPEFLRRLNTIKF
jgi:hypothetical protein